MKQLTVVLFLFIVLALSINGQSSAQKAVLNRAIATYSNQTIKVLNKKDSSFRYTLKNKNIFYSDLNADGQFDAVVEMFFCERTSCHPTTNKSELAVYIFNKGVFSFVASKGFTLYGKVNSIDDGIINIDIYGLEEDDPQCCPQLKRQEKYVLKEKSLTKVR